MRMEQKKIGNILSLIGIVFFSTTATVMITAVWTLFLVEDLHLSPSQIGWIEGGGVFIGLMSKVLSGVIADITRKRRGIIVAGTFFSVLSKTCFVLVTGFLSAFFIKIMDRMAKGLRSCPSDAILADSSQSRHHGWVYSAKYCLFSCGAICGGGITHFLLRIFPHRYKLVFLIAIIPTLIAFVLAKFFVQDQQQPQSEGNPFRDKDDDSDDPIPHLSSSKMSWIRKLTSLDRNFLKFLIIVFFLMFARFSESFLMMKAQDLEISPPDISKLIPYYDLFALGGMGLAATLLWKVPQTFVLTIAVIMQICAHGIAFFAVNDLYLMCSIAFFGLHLGMSQGTLLTVVTKFSHHHNRGLAFSFYYFVTGMGLLLSNLLAGKVHTLFNSSSFPFLFGALFAALSLGLILFLMRSKSGTSSHQNLEIQDF